MNMLKYKRAFVANPNYRFDPQDIFDVADDIVYVCDTPMFDNLMGDEYSNKFEQKIVQRMKDFDPKNDVIVYYGDSLIFVLMIMWLADGYDTFDVARFSTKQNKYLIRTLSYGKFIEPQEPSSLEHQERPLRPALRPALR